MGKEGNEDLRGLGLVLRNGEKVVDQLIIDLREVEESLEKV